MDKYPEFSYSINPTVSDFVKIRGSSWGINTNYKFDLEKNLLLKFGVGFYQYSFNKIERETKLFGKSKSRVLNFPSPVYIIFGTDKYWYYSISTNIGIEKVFDFGSEWKISAGILISNYYTFSQTYHMKPDYHIGRPT